MPVRNPAQQKGRTLAHAAPAPGAPFWARLDPGFHTRRIQPKKDGPGFHAFVWRGVQPGPALLVNGGTHGDEYEGPVLLAQMVQSWRPRHLRGTLIAVPVLNEDAFLA